MSTDEKRCTGPCGQMKPLVAFHKKKSGCRGRKAWCRECVSQHEKERREKIRVPPKNLAINMVEKRCSGPCGQVKPLEDFYEDRRHTNGRRSYCKDCVCERQKVYRGNNRAEREAYNKAYHKEGERGSDSNTEGVACRKGKRSWCPIEECINGNTKRSWPLIKKCIESNIENDWRWPLWNAPK